jgi:hypothetical protein
MAFMNNNNFSNSNNNGGEKKKTNFKVGKLYGEDGIMDISVWKSDTGCFTILSVKSAVGKDPSTGAPVYEQKMPNELPRVFLNQKLLYVLLKALEANDPATANFTIEGRSKVTVAGSGSTVKMTLVDPKNGERSITFKSTQAGSSTVFAEYAILQRYLEICFKKALINKLDPDEFGMAVGSDDTAEATNEDSPF